MFMKLIEKVIGTRNDREIKKLWPLVKKVKELDPEMSTLSNDELKRRGEELRSRVLDGESEDDLLFEAFALVKEVAWRTIGLKPYDVQVMGGIVLHQGKIAEMKTGEGKTLVASMPMYLNALSGKGAHLVTVNDYLARRDALWMGPIYLFLGLSVGVIQHDASFLVQWDNPKRFVAKLVPCERREAYAADITYGQNNEFGFDYLRDNMAWEIEDCVQRELHYAIVDEVDPILIDEARTPLIISGPAEEDPGLYYKADAVVAKLKKDVDYEIDEEAHSAMLTEEGMAKVEELLGVENLYDPSNIRMLHHVEQALKAHTLFKRDVDYVIQDGKVVIVDEFTGRLMPGRRWSDGLHQAIEAKERVKIESENQTLATITFQNYFRMYDKLAGMTGTAATEAGEFMEIYNLDVIEIPTHKPMIRIDYPDVVYRTQREKFKAVVDEIVELNKKGQPILVGTTSIENSEKLSAMLKKRRVRHHVLNAKHHEREAEIIAQAGRVGAVTIATNMAGRGTDILLGGNPEALAKASLLKKYASEGEIPEEEWEEALRKAKEITEAEHQKVIELGGLHIIGTERHEARRVDNQLRGRAGRQGDPGSSRFFLSLEDDLLRIFGSERISKIMEKLGMEEGEPIEHPMISKAIENAQRKVEAHNFEIRKHLLEYDDVLNKQREAIYSQRRAILEGKDLREDIMDMLSEAVEEMVNANIPEKGEIEEENYASLAKEVERVFSVKLDPEALKNYPSRPQLREHIEGLLRAEYEKKEEEGTPEGMRGLERMVMLYTLDGMWREHLLAMDHLREGIGLRGYGQKDPLSEYKKESYELFVDMLSRLREQVLSTLFKVQIVSEEEQQQRAMSRRERRRYKEHRGDMPTGQTYRREGRKIGRNEPCPCGSGKKYKHCCGKVA